MNGVRTFLAELRRRKVYQVAAVYAAVAFLVWQVADIAFPSFGLPEEAVVRAEGQRKHLVRSDRQTAGAAELGPRRRVLGLGEGNEGEEAEAGREREEGGLHGGILRRSLESGTIPRSYRPLVRASRGSGSSS